LRSKHESRQSRLKTTNEYLANGVETGEFPPNLSPRGGGQEDNEKIRGKREAKMGWALRKSTFGSPGCWQSATLGLEWKKRVKGKNTAPAKLPWYSQPSQPIWAHLCSTDKGVAKDKRREKKGGNQE
jgi:hypothetical protein